MWKRIVSAIGLLSVPAFSGAFPEPPNSKLAAAGAPQETAVFAGGCFWVQVTFDPSKISYGQLLKVFFAVANDPTQKNRQGPDEGTQYRSAIFYTNPAQKEVAEAYIRDLNNAHVFKRAIVTEVVALPEFFPAEGYHQKFAEKNPGHPYIAFHDLPKLKSLKSQYPEMVK